MTQEELVKEIDAIIDKQDKELNGKEDVNTISDELQAKHPGIINSQVRNLIYDRIDAYYYGHAFESDFDNFRKETITVDGIDCKVGYNAEEFTREDIEKFLKAGFKNPEQLEYDLSEFELFNYDEVLAAIKNRKPKKTVVMDCSDFVEFQHNRMGDPLDQMANELKRFGFSDVKDLGGGLFELTGGRGDFSFYHQFMGHDPKQRKALIKEIK